MIDINLTLQSDKVILRPIIIEDFEKFIHLTNDKKMWTYYPLDLSIKSELEEWVNIAIRHMEEKTRIAFTIVNKDNNKIIGSTSFGNISENDKRIEIGWTWICREYQGKGVNDQIKNMMMKHCFEEFHFERVEFKTDVLNIHARNALKRIGAVEEGILRSHTQMTNNRRRDTIYYSVLKSEWRNLKLINDW